MNKTKNIGRDILFGISVGDAMGVPVEFISREELSQNPVTDMRAFGTFNQPKGTWSDDSSLTFCLAESLLNGFNLKDIAIKMIQFKDDAGPNPNIDEDIDGDLQSLIRQVRPSGSNVSVPTPTASGTGLL
jgi:ADP-ribosylglycohydrolase